MSTKQGPLAKRWNEMPRAMRWGVLAGIVILAYFVVIERTIEVKNHWNGRADLLQRDLTDKAKTRQATADSATLVEQATGVFGRPLLPAKENDRVSQVDNRINKIFAAHKVQSERKITREPRPMPQDAPPSLVPSGQQLAKLEKELSFETDMATLTVILKELEQAPEIAAVSRLVLKKQQQSSSSRRSNEPGPLSVSITIEAWVTIPLPAPQGASRATSASAGGGGGGGGCPMSSPMNTPAGSTGGHEMLHALIAPSRRVGTLVVLVAIITAIICVWSSLALQVASSIPVTQAPRPVAEDRLDKSKSAYDSMLTSSSDVVIARAPFGQIKVPVSKAKDAAKSLVSSTYGGPELTGIADNFAWFRDGKRIKLGAEVGGLKVLALDPPWSAQLRWSNGEYKVKLFDRSMANLAQSMSVWLGAPPPPPPPATHARRRPHQAPINRSVRARCRSTRDWRARLHSTNPRRASSSQAARGHSATTSTGSAALAPTRANAIPRTAPRTRARS